MEFDDVVRRRHGRLGEPDDGGAEPGAWRPCPPAAVTPGLFHIALHVAIQRARPPATLSSGLGLLQPGDALPACTGRGGNLLPTDRPLRLIPASMLELAVGQPQSVASSGWKGARQVGARGFEPVGPTPRIVIPDSIANALSGVA